MVVTKKSRGILAAEVEVFATISVPDMNSFTFGEDDRKGVKVEATPRHT